MLKVVAILGALVMVAIAYFAWVMVQASKTFNLSPQATVYVHGDRIRVTVTFTGMDIEHRVTEIRFTRTLGEALGISAPDGFTTTPYTLDDSADPKAPESAVWLEAANATDIRWTGSQVLSTTEPTVFDFAISDERPGTGTFVFQYERRLGLGGQISFFNTDAIVGPSS